MVRTPQVRKRSSGETGRTEVGRAADSGRPHGVDQIIDLTDAGSAPAVVAGRSGLARRLGRLPSAYMYVTSDAGFIALPALWTPRHTGAILLFAALSVLLLWTGDLYRPRVQALYLDDLPRFLTRTLAAGGLLAAFLAARSDAGALGFLPAASEGLALAAAGRLGVNLTVKVARRRGWVEHRTLLVGAGPVTERLARTLASAPQYGLRPVGYLSDVPAGPGSPLQSLAYLGNVGDLCEVIEAREAQVIVLSEVGPTEALLALLCRQALVRRCNIFIVPRLHEVLRQSSTTETIGAVPVVRIDAQGTSGLPWRCKRIFDIVLTAAALVALSPALSVCALAVRLDGGPGVLFRQVRVGRDGVPFELLKFRTLRPTDVSEAATRWSVAGDHRLSRVGRWMRATSLDELPQLWNILRGDMTIVGPRPERPYFVEKFTAEEPGYAFRHRFPAGLTGLAQVNGMRGDTSIAERSSFDNYYIENWSLWLDIKVIVRTVAEVCGARGR